MRITETIAGSKDKGLFKNNRCFLHGWTLEPTDQARLENNHEPEMRLLHMPAMLFLRFPKATWQWNSALGRGIIGITPKVVRWYVDKDFQVSVQRRGFSVAADLAGTAHSFAGETLQAAFLDIMSRDASPDRGAQLGAYMSLSRVRRMEDICVVRAFPPTLLAQGIFQGLSFSSSFRRRRCKKRIWRLRGERGGNRAYGQHTNCPTRCPSIAGDARSILAP